MSFYFFEPTYHKSNGFLINHPYHTNTNERISLFSNPYMKNYVVYPFYNQHHYSNLYNRNRANDVHESFVHDLREALKEEQQESKNLKRGTSSHSIEIPITEVSHEPHSDIKQEQNVNTPEEKEQKGQNINVTNTSFSIPIYFKKTVPIVSTEKDVNVQSTESTEKDVDVQSTESTEKDVDVQSTESTEKDVNGQPTESTENDINGQPIEATEKDANGQPTESTENNINGQPTEFTEKDIYGQATTKSNKEDPIQNKKKNMNTEEHQYRIFEGLSKLPYFSHYEQSIIYSPKIDIIEDEKKYHVYVDLPGMTKEQIEMEILEENIIKISGERKSRQHTDTDKKSHYIIMERDYGHFERSFMIPSNANTDSIQAKMENGVMEILIDKKEVQKKQARTIQIQ